MLKISAEIYAIGAFISAVCCVKAKPVSMLTFRFSQFKVILNNLK